MNLNPTNSRVQIHLNKDNNEPAPLLAVEFFPDSVGCGNYIAFFVFVRCCR